MSRRAAHHHLAWESQPLLRPVGRRHGHATRMVVIAFILGLLIGLLV